MSPIRAPGVRVTRAQVENVLQMLDMEHMRGNLYVLQDAVVEWADFALPEREAPAAIMKLFEELGEVFKNPRDPKEWADVLILILDLMRHYGVDPHDAVVGKLRDMMDREWHRSDAGTFHHIRKEGEQT